MALQRLQEDIINQHETAFSHLFPVNKSVGLNMHKIGPDEIFLPLVLRIVVHFQLLRSLS